MFFFIPFGAEEEIQFNYHVWPKKLIAKNLKQNGKPFFNKGP